MKNPFIQLQLEASAFFVLTVLLYTLLPTNYPDTDWLTFLTYFFVPDAAILLYVISPRVGGTAYNISHCFVFPVTLFALGSMSSTNPGLPMFQTINHYYSQMQGSEDAIPYYVYYQASLIWASHLAFDRMLGWGLKFDDSFFHTHLGNKSILHWGKNA